MAGLTFVNQVGAVDGMNQAAPGTLIPDTFVRWSQDVLFDRAGLMRRRGPFNEYKLYYNNTASGSIEEWDFTDPDATDERILGVFATYDPAGNERIGILVSLLNESNSYSTILRVFDNTFKFLGSETLPFNIPPLSIVTGKPALGGGLWISAVESPANVGTHYVFYWRGGYSSKTSSVTGTFTLETIDNFSNEHKGLSTTITMGAATTMDDISVGQFVYATYSGSDYYLGVVKSISTSSKTVTFEKRPFIWNSTVDNNHGLVLTPNNLSSSSGTATIRVNEAMLFEIGDVVTVNTGTAAYNGTFTVTAINTAPAVGLQTFSYTLGSSPATVTSPTGTITMAKDLNTMTLSGVSLKFISVRPYTHRHGRGLLTITDSGGTAIVSGDAGTSGDGHWQAANVAGYNVYRASDNAYIGKVKTVTNNTTAALNSDSGVQLNGEEYIMRSTDNAVLSGVSTDFCVGASSYNTPYNFAGLYTTVYAGMQWYGSFAQDDKNTNRVVFSAYHDKEAVDLSRDAADSIIFPGKSKFRGLGSSVAGLLVFLEDRTYILRGNDRTNFSVEQLIPEGCLCPSSIVEYGGGVFWAGKSGIMFFDGASVRNLTKDNLGLYYTDSLDAFNAETDRVIGFIHKNNLIMHYTSWKSPFDPIRYEPVYAADWLTTNAIKDKKWTEFDPDFSYEDFHTQNNTPIYWDRSILNKSAEGSQSGLGFTWGSTSNSVKWGNTSNAYKWGPVRKNTTITFCVYLPTNAITTLSNLDPRGSATLETAQGIKTIMGVNSVESSVTRVVQRKSLMSNVATLRISGGDSFEVGDSVTVSIGDAVFDGTYTISAVSAANHTISYAKTNANVTDAAATGTVTRTFSSALRARIIDIHPVFDTITDGPDEFTVEKLNIPYADLITGPDFYLQTKHYTVGDPVLRKWFQRIMLSMLLYDGCIRMDFVDDDDNDSVDINKKKHRYWDLFTEHGYDWTYLTDIQLPKITSPDTSTWGNVEDTAYEWDELFTADFNRYMKRFSWRKSSFGIRLYQLNKYKKPYNGVVTKPMQVELQALSIGFKPMRQGRV